MPYFVHCPSGYFGINCSEKCEPPSYGFICCHVCAPDCQKRHHIAGCTLMNKTTSKLNIVNR